LINKLKSAFLFLFVSFLLPACSAQTAGGRWGGMALSPAWNTTLTIVVLVVMLLGLLSLLLYVIPGLTIIWLAGLIYGFLKGFDRNGLWIFAAMTLLMIFGNLVDQLLMGAKARQSGASWAGVILSTIAALVFSLLFPPFGGLVAALVVLFVVEVIRLRNIAKAGQSTREMAVGCATAIAARFGIGLLMIGLWCLWVWLGGGWPF
jgi:uncharacterized protein YqgC (DUF456 family)